MQRVQAKCSGLVEALIYKKSRTEMQIDMCKVVRKLDVRSSIIALFSTRCDLKRPGT